MFRMLNLCPRLNLQMLATIKFMQIIVNLQYLFTLFGIGISFCKP